LSGRGLQPWAAAVRHALVELNFLSLPVTHLEMIDWVNEKVLTISPSQPKLNLDFLCLVIRWLQTAVFQSVALAPTSMALVVGTVLAISL